MRYRVFFAIVLCLSFTAAWAEEPEVDQEIVDSVAAVQFHGEDIFEVTNISTLSAEARAELLAKRLKKLAKSPLINTNSFTLHHDDDLKISVIMSGSDVVCAVWESDAQKHGMARGQLAEHWQNVIRDIVDKYRKDRTAKSYIRGVIYAVVDTVVFLVILRIICLLRRKEIKVIEEKFAGQQMFKFLEGDSVVTVNGNLVKIVCAITTLCLFIVYLNLVLSFFPWMFNLSARLFELITTPFINFGHAFVESLPDLFAILVIGFITRFILRALRHIFTQIGEGKVRIKGFYKDWADTTYSLFRMVIVVFALVAAFPYIPGSSSPAFKGITIFMGVLVSLGSSSAVGNIFGGLVLTYMRSFSTGDFVEINGVSGTVMSRRTFSIRLKTPTNEIISIPNASVSTNHIVNYSQMTKSLGVNIGTTVTLGYDVPWRKIHELLLKSAEGVPDVLEEPAPTILQLSLDDFYVKYKLIVSTKFPARRFRILSNLHQNIQDNFAKADVEILSPHYQADRSGEGTTVPTSETPEA